jgi:hypothetical protein
MIDKQVEHFEIVNKLARLGKLTNIGTGFAINNGTDIDTISGSSGN